MHEVSTDRVVIIGAGLAAVYAALMLAPCPVLVISPEPLGTGASSSLAQGGIAAAMADTDSAAAHARDTIRAGAGSVLSDMAAFVTKEAREHVLALQDFGTRFDRSDEGAFLLSREAAHSAARVVRVKGDQAGAEIMRALVAEVRQTLSVQVVEGITAIKLESDGERVNGVHVSSAGSAGAETVLLRGSAYVLASGGAAGLYDLTTNPKQVRGQGVGMAARAGARIADAEFVQFHPTSIDVGDDPAPLATEALRGEGAVLINNQGHRFMLEQHPDAELAPRDVVARAVYQQTQAGNRPALDTRASIGTDILSRFPTVAQACIRNSLNPSTSPIPVAAAAHYHMGGVATDKMGRTSLAGLWACGEVASTGLHGANRLASNGLLEALVFARACARDVAPRIQSRDVRPVVLGISDQARGDDPAAVAALRKVMTNGVGVVRDGDGLRLALFEIARLEAKNTNSPAFLNMTAAATMIAAAALQRQESRGAHCRSDFPQAAPFPGQRSILTLSQALDIRNTISKDFA